LLGPPGIGLLRIAIERDAPLLRMVTEIALLVSLFALGLRLRVPLRDRLWAVPWRLGVVALALTVPLLAAVGALARG
ncbi:cation transporter, partial [Burkholderia pseudomallei]